MNKKNIVLVLILACFLTIMAISIWGKMPELSNRVAVNGLTIYDTANEEITDVNDSSRKEKKITLNYSDNTVTYTFSVAVLPANATDVSLNFEVLSGSESVDLKELSIKEFMDARGEEYTAPTDENGNEIVITTNIHYYSITFTEQKPCLICFTTNKTDTVKRDYLQFAWTGSSHSDVIDI